MSGAGNSTSQGEAGSFVFNNYETNVELKSYDRFDDSDLSLKDEIVRGVYAMGFERLSPIQRIAIKPIVSGEDIVVQSHSGTGKTATFVISALQRINTEVSATQAIIVSNTRELAEQTQRVFDNLSTFMGATSYLCIGGDMSNKYMASTVQQHVVIGTPGRLCDMIKRGYVDTSQVKMIIVDEADEVLSSGFRKQVSMIFRALPEATQTVLISATIPEEMSDLLQHIMRRNYISILVKNDEITLDGIRQHYAQLDERYKMNAIIDVLRLVSFSQCVIYCNKKQRADEIHRVLTDESFKVAVLHSDLLPKERKDVLNQFVKGQFRVIVTTDVMARGIDVQQISLVVNFDMPKQPSTYIHRIGRSGRFGRQGMAINFVVPQEMPILSNIQKTYNTNIYYLPENLSELNSPLAGRSSNKE